MSCDPTTSWSTLSTLTTAFQAGCAKPTTAFGAAVSAPPATAWGCASPDVAVYVLAMLTQPAGAEGDVALTTQPVVRVLDRLGNPVAVDGMVITASIDSGTLIGATTALTANGVAVFSGLGFADTPWVTWVSKTLTFAATDAASVSATPVVAPLGNNLGAWFRASSARNTYNANTPPELQTAQDLSGHARDIALDGGVIKRLTAALNGIDGLDFSTAGNNYLGNVVLPVQGSLTWFGVFKITSSVFYQALFDVLLDANSWLFWDQPTNKWQLDGLLAGANVAGSYVTFVVHFYNSAGAMQIKARVNGTQILAQQAAAPATPVPGAVGAPSNKTFRSFNRGGGQTFSSQILEWGFFTKSQDGSEGGVNGVETYLRAQYATW